MGTFSACCKMPVPTRNCLSNFRRTDDITQLHEQRIKIRGEKDDLPKRRRELEDELGDLARLAKELGWDATGPVELIDRVPTRGKIARLHSLEARRGKLETEVEAASKADEGAQTSLSEKMDRLNHSIVECKLWRNPEARRGAVSQILDYAKEISRWSYDELNDAVCRAARRSGNTNALFDIVRAQHDTLDEGTFVDDVARSLTSGRFLLIVVGRRHTRRG